MRISATRHLATAIAAVLLGFPAACTTMTPLAPDANGEHIRAAVKAGDTVRVLVADGTTHLLKVSALSESSLTGSASQGGTDVAGSRIDLPWREIRQIEVQRVSGSRTAGLTALLVVVAAVAIASAGGSHTPGYTR